MSEDISKLIMKVRKGKPRKTTMFTKMKSNASKAIKKTIKHEDSGASIAETEVLDN